MLKFENDFTVGDKIRAYDFRPTSDRPAMYVEGTVVDAGMTEGGYKAFTIKVSRDTTPAQRIGDFVFVPMQVSLMEYDNRIISI